MSADPPGSGGALLPCGVYEHHKGGRYLVLGVARDDRDETPLVIYARLYGRGGLPLSARPLAQFVGEVEVDGASVARFRFIGLTDPG